MQVGLRACCSDLSTAKKTRGGGLMFRPSGWATLPKTLKGFGGFSAHYIRCGGFSRQLEPGLEEGLKQKILSPSIKRGLPPQRILKLVFSLPEPGPNCCFGFFDLPNIPSLQKPWNRPGGCLGPHSHRKGRHWYLLVLETNMSHLGWP